MTITTGGAFANIRGVVVPAGTSTVYDQTLGKNIKRPFLHVRYRASEADDRKNEILDYRFCRWCDYF